MKKELLLAAIAASVLAACATTDTEGEHAYVEKEYRTGSNLAVKRSTTADGVTTLSRDDVERTRNGSLEPGRSMPAPSASGVH